MRRLFKRKNIFLLVSLLKSLVIIYHIRFSYIAETLDRWNNRNTEQNVLPVFNKHGSWGNYEPLEKEIGRRRGEPGEMGQPHVLKGDRVKRNRKRIKDIYGINQLVSDEISLDRDVPDFREHECKHMNYETDLPKVSIIIVFFNEGLSTLFRTIHSVIKRTPRALLHEIILVDDQSEYDYLRHYLPIKLQQTLYKNLVKLVSNKHRTGYIKSLTKGAISANGEVLVFLDAHCEVGYNWLPPLLQPISEYFMTISTPIIDEINPFNFKIDQNYPNSTYKRGIFDWGLEYKEDDLPDSLKSRRISDPYPSPTLDKLIFAVKKSWFKELGWFDTGLQGCHGGNFELSFKLWQCGGRLHRVPCSRVARIQSSDTVACDAVTIMEKDGVPHHLRNFKRIVETWFDAVSKDYFYRRQPLATFFELSDLSIQLEYKKRKNCKSFPWFTKEVLNERNPPPAPNIYWGKLLNQGTNLCAVLQTEPISKVIWVNCNELKNSQIWTLAESGHLSIGKWCAVHSPSTNISFKECGKEGNWALDESSGQLYIKPGLSCLSVEKFTLKVFLDKCDDTNIFQRWVIKPVETQWTTPKT